MKKDRTIAVISGCRRARRRMRNLIRKPRLITDHLTMSGPLVPGDDARRDLAKCLKRGGFPRHDANRVDERLKRSRQLWPLAARGDDQRRRFARREAFRPDKNAVVGEAA